MIGADSYIVIGMTSHIHMIVGTTAKDLEDIV